MFTASRIAPYADFMKCSGVNPQLLVSPFDCVGLAPVQRMLSYAAYSITTCHRCPVAPDVPLLTNKLGDLDVVTR